MKFIQNALKSGGKALLCLMLCTGVLLSAASCNSSDNPADSSFEQTTDSGAVTTTVPSDDSSTTPTGDPIDIVVNKETEYKIVYPAGAIKPTRDIYTSLKTNIRMNIGYSFDMVKDSGAEAGAHEILIGKTNRPASTEAYEKLKENQFSFTLSGDSIVIAASDDACMKLAVNTFVDKYAKEDGKLTVYTGDFPVTYACGDNYKTVTIDNTADVEGDDPYVIEHDGYYYYCWSNNGVMVARIDNLNKITKENGKQVFNRQQNGFESVWAPELHYIDGEWYIYVAMCKGTGDNAAHRMYCLKGTSQDPTDPFKLVGQVTDDTNKWAIDGTVFKYKGELYTVWSGWPGDTDGCQNLYIAHMSNPWTIDSKRVLISTPTTWDGKTQNPKVNEGPFVMVVGDTIHVLYSGNGSWTDDYCVGYVTFSGGEILKSNNWKKSSTAILSQSAQNYGPGHCSVVQADDGSYQIIYHANIKAGTGWSGRSVRVQELTVTEESVKLVTRRALKSDLKISEKYVIGPVTD